MTLKTIKINTKSKSYNIFIGSNILGNLRTFLRRENLRLNKSLLIIDKNIPINFTKLLIKNFNKRNLFILYFVSNENNKDQRSIEKIHNTLFSKNFNRDDCIVSFGGGILGDVAGFAASTYKRGIKFINIPSTLLSQVDSSIGGKTGINNKFGKNLIGSFYQPDLVISDTKVLKSLPKREIICGYAEILKSCLLDSKKSFKFIDNNLNKILSLDDHYITNAILISCLLKKKVVEKDEKEKNLRKILNLGHTFAHAYEASLSYSKKLNHGEAVIIGLKNSINFSRKLKKVSTKNYQLINNHLNRIKLKPEIYKLIKKIKISKIINFMKSDKKNTSNKINLILLNDFGRIQINYQAKISQLKNFLVEELNKKNLQ